MSNIQRKTRRAGRGSFQDLRIHARIKKTKPCILVSSSCLVETYPWTAVIFRVKKIWFVNKLGMKNRSWDLPPRLPSGWSIRNMDANDSRASEPPSGPRGAEAWLRVTPIPSALTRADTGKKPTSAAQSKGGPRSPRLSYILLDLMDSVGPGLQINPGNLQGTSEKWSGVGKAQGDRSN